MVTDQTAGPNQKEMSVQILSGSEALHRADLQQAMREFQDEHLSHGLFIKFL